MNCSPDFLNPAQFTLYRHCHSCFAVAHTHLWELSAIVNLFVRCCLFQAACVTPSSPLLLFVCSCWSRARILLCLYSTSTIPAFYVHPTTYITGRVSPILLPNPGCACCEQDLANSAGTPSVGLLLRFVCVSSFVWFLLLIEFGFHQFHSPFAGRWMVCFVECFLESENASPMRFPRGYYRLWRARNSGFKFSSTGRTNFQAGIAPSVNFETFLHSFQWVQILSAPALWSVVSNTVTNFDPSWFPSSHNLPF